MAPPKKWTERRRREVRARMQEFIRKEACPSIAKFAIEYDVPRRRLYEWEELEETIDMLRAKREKYLEEKLLFGDEKKATGTIFALKQLGWTDKQETQHTGQVQHTHVVELPKQDSVDTWQKQQQIPDDQKKLNEK